MEVTPPPKRLTLFGPIIRNLNPKYEGRADGF